MFWNSVLSFIAVWYPWFGIAGSLLIILCMCVAGLVYRGADGERYSVLNHYISELGEVGVSQAAVVFNAGLIVGSLLFVPFVVGMGLVLDNTWAKIGMAVGIWSTLSCALVGVFPMNHMNIHSKVALSYFRSGLVMVLLYSTAVFAQRAGEIAIPKLSNLAGLLAFLCYGSFLAVSDSGKKKETEESDNPRPKEDFVRPRYWKAAILEWLVFFSTILWFLIVALFTLR